MAFDERILFVHGWGTSGGVWRRVIEALDRGFLVENPTLSCHAGRGATCGAHPPCSAPISEPGALCPVVRSAVSAMGAGDGLVGVGWSLGAQTLMKHEMTMPGTFSKLVLVGATPCFARRRDFPHGKPRAMVRRMIADMERAPAETLRRFVLLNFTEEELSSPGVRAFVEGAATRCFDDADLKGLGRSLSAISETDLREGLSRIRIPVLLIHGEKDAVTPVEAARYLNERLEGSTLEVIDGAGHAPFISDPAGFGRLLKAFIRNE